MKSRFIVFFTLLLCLLHLGQSWLLWAWKEEELLADNQAKMAPVPRRQVPFEMKTAEESFLAEAKATQELSELDFCHHRVIAELTSSCSNMKEEELSKLAVNLLNCQSQAEERRVYPCAYDMTIAECTQDMDPTTWNAYQIVSNRARSLCYATRQHQFRLKTEHSVNHLVSATEGQIEAMKDIQEGQAKLSDITDETLKKMQGSQKELMLRQNGIKASQMDIQTFIANNLRDLTREKALIATGNRELANMTETILQKLDSATVKLNQHEINQQQNQLEILQDLAAIREKAKEVFTKIDQSSHDVLQYHDQTTEHYHDTLENLNKVNQTVSFLLDAVQAMQDDVESKLDWITSYLDGTGDHLALLTTVVFHIGYFLLAAMGAAFLRIPMFSRLVLLLLVPLNAWSELTQHQSLGFTAMTLFIILTVIANWIVNWWLFRRFQFPHSHQASHDRQYAGLQALEDAATPRVPSNSPVSSNDNNFVDVKSPEFRRLLNAIETLCKQGGASNSAWKTFADSGLDSSPPGDSLLPEHGESRKPSHTPPPSPIRSSLDTSVSSTVSPYLSRTRIEMVKRQLLNSPLNADTSVRKSNRRNSFCRESTPVPNSPNRSLVSQTSTPRSVRRGSTSSISRPLCTATTKTGQLCRLTQKDGSPFCHRHQGEALDSD